MSGRAMLGWRALWVLAGMLLAWPVLQINLGRYYLDQAGQGDAEALRQALAWVNGLPEALAQEAASRLEEEPDEAAALLRRALWGHPAQAYATALLAVVLRETDQEQADRLALLASRLAPAEPGTRRLLAGYWLERGDLQRAVADWSAALANDPALREELFPVFLQIAADPDKRGSLSGLAAAPPTWWDEFFAFAARRAGDYGAVVALYQMRQASEEPIHDAERRSYVERLMREGEWSGAYAAWLEGLDDDERRSARFIYDGGFELKMDGIGFDWHVQRAKGVVVRREHVFGVSDEKALHLVFQGRQLQFRHVFQPLRLDPGRHRLSGRSKLDSLLGRGGIRWHVECADGRVIGQGPLLVGAADWEPFSFDFEVPEAGCSGQVLRLVSSGRRAADHRLKGGVWFDDLLIRRLDR